MIIINTQHAEIVARKIYGNADEVARLEVDTVELVRAFKANLDKLEEMKFRAAELGSQFKLSVECLTRVAELQGE